MIDIKWYHRVIIAIALVFMLFASNWVLDIRNIYVLAAGLVFGVGIILVVGVIMFMALLAWPNMRGIIADLPEQKTWLRNILLSVVIGGLFTFMYVSQWLSSLLPGNLGRGAGGAVFFMIGAIFGSYILLEAGYIIVRVCSCVVLYLKKWCDRISNRS